MPANHDLVAPILCRWLTWRADVCGYDILICFFAPKVILLSRATAKKFPKLLPIRIGKWKLRDAVLAGLKAEFSNVLKQQADLNREMMLLPIDTRCRRWMEYYTRLDELTKRQQKIEAAALADAVSPKGVPGRP